MGNSKEISVFCCANSYDKLAVMRSLNLQDTKLNIISLPCSGKLDILYLVKTFEAGVDGAVVMMCGEGECHYVEGNKRAKKRVAAVGSLLEEIGLGKDRVSFIQVNGGGTEQAIRDLEEFCLKIKNLTHDEEIKTTA